MVIDMKMYLYPTAELFLTAEDDVLRTSFLMLGEGSGDDEIVGFDSDFKPL